MLLVFSVTASGSIDETRRMGTKILLREVISTTSPRTRGC